MARTTFPRNLQLENSFGDQGGNPHTEKEAEEGFTARDVGSQNRVAKTGRLKGSQLVAVSNPR